MTWPPTCSADVAEIREAQAELDDVVEALAAERDRRQLEHETRCSSGWLGEDASGRPIPCLVCRPHLDDGAKPHD